MNNTMKLEQQVTSLELAKRLKELNCPQDSLFYWWGTFNYRPYPQPEQYEEHEKERAYQDQDWQVSLKKDIFDEDSRSWKGMYKNTLDIFSAFSVAELGNLMPKEIEDTNSEGLKRLFFFDTWKCNSGFLWRCAYSYYENMNRANTRIEYLKGVDGDIGAEAEADCRAKMLIWLIEEGYITQ